MWIGTAKMQLKVMEGGKGELSGYSTEEGGRLSTEDIFQKIRNYVCLCLSTLIRQCPKTAINTKNFLLLVTPCLFSQQLVRNVLDPQEL